MLGKTIKSILFIFVLFPFFGITQTVMTYSTAGSYTWTAPCDVTSIQIECWGGGGGGGSASANPSAGGGGAGGGYVKNTSFTVVPGTTYNIWVGVGGASVTAGEDSWFGSASTVKAVGGYAGSSAASVNQTAAGALAQTTGNVGFSGSFSYYGGAGGTGGASGASGGGGGGSAGTGSNGNNASVTTGGTAVTGGGAGANGSTSNATGSAATTLGGGGAGGRKTTGGTKNGGAGYAGKVVLTYTTSLTYTYCTPSFTSNSEPITNVTFAGINNTTSGTTGGSQYESFCSTASVVLGSTTNSISVSGNTDGNFTNYISVYFDWNHDGDFADAGESNDIGTISNCTSCSVTGTISVPCTATVGTTMMRVMKKYGGYVTSSCNTTGYGQAEDYPVTITAEPSSSTPTAQPTSLSLSAVSGSQINGSFTASSPASGNYLVVRTATSSAPSPAPVDGTTYSVGGTVGGGTVVAFSSSTSFSATGLSSNTQYWFWIYSCNGTCSPKYLTTSPLSSNATTMNVINWIGAGVSGGTGGTDFNTAANWSPNTVPTSTDNANITTTTAATITLSADVTIGSLTILNNATGAVTLALDATTRVLTINGDLLANVNAAGGVSTILSLRVGNSPGNIIVGGTTTLGNNTNVDSYIEVTGSAGGTTTGAFTMKGNTYFGRTYYMYAGYIGNFVWDGTGAQTIYTNDTYSVYLNGSVQIGNSNTPTVTVSTSGTTNLYVYSAIGGNLTVKAGSTLDLSTKIFNKSTSAPSVAGGTLTLEAGAKLRLAATTGGQAGSNFPLNFTTASPVLNATSTVEYYGTSDQTIYDVASPGYGNLTLTNNSIKAATAGLDVQGALTINSTSTFAAGTSLTHNVGGNWLNSGTFSYTTGSTIVLNGSSNQSIGGTSTTSFNNLTNSNTSTGITLNRGILVSGTLAMSGATADIFLNGYNIDLSSTGTLSGESNTDRIYGTSGVITTTRNLSNITALDVAGMGCVLTTTANMGSTTISRGHSASSGTGLISNTLKRYYSITPTNNSGLNATMVFNYFDNEMNGLSANESSFKLFRSTDGGSSWTDRFGSVVPASNNVTLPLIDAFSIWTVSVNDAVILPIELTSFEAQNEGNINLIKWTTVSELNNDYYILERSVDGKSFDIITTIDGAGNSNELIEYRFEDKDFIPTINYYRLTQTDFNGDFKRSQIISVDNRLNAKEISKVINIHGQEVNESYKGVVIIIYKDGSILRTIQD